VYQLKYYSRKNNIITLLKCVEFYIFLHRQTKTIFIIMKKLFLILLVGGAALTFSACGNKAKTEEAADTTAAVVETPAVDTTAVVADTTAVAADTTAAAQ